MNKFTSKAVALVSGGLDSLLAVKLVQSQGIYVQGLFFETPFFSDKKVSTFCGKYGIPLKVIPIFDEYKRMLLSPASGYGKNMNPCIDCHALMLKKASEYARENGFDFIITGEVLGERPMSQNRYSLNRVANLSGAAGLIVRPLSAKLLPPTEPEQKGLIDREKLEAISGRGRFRQYELAEKFGISEIPQPGGGCLLTDKNIADRLRFLFKIRGGNLSERDARLVKTGRYLHLGNGQLLIVGRNEKENEALQRSYSREKDILLVVMSHPGPAALLPEGAQMAQNMITFCASVCARYSDLADGEQASVLVTTPEKEIEVKAGKAKEEDFRKFFDLST